MTKRRIPASTKRLTGNRSNKAILPDISLPIQPIRCPKLSKTAKKYWKLWAPLCSKAKTLNAMTAETFAQMCDIAARLHDIRIALDETNKSLLQEKSIVDSAGREHLELRESAYSNMYRQYNKLFLDFAKQFHRTPQSARGVYNFDGDKGEEL